MIGWGVIRTSLAALALSGWLAGCGPTSQYGPVSKARPLVVSLNPCSDAILAEVADPGQILAISHYSKDPRSSSMAAEVARRLPATGGTVEEVLALRPDIIIGTSFIDPATQRAYSRLGLRLETLGIAHDVDESRAQIRKIAALAGHPDRGEALIARIDAALSRAAPPVRRHAINAVVWQGGGMVPGRNTLILDLLRRTGFANFSVVQGYRQADILPLEAVLAHPPQVIITTVGSRELGEGSNRALLHPALGRLQGTAHYDLDPRFLYCGGPTIIHAARRLAAIREELASRGMGGTIQ